MIMREALEILSFKISSVASISCLCEIMNIGGECLFRSEHRRTSLNHKIQLVK